MANNSELVSLDYLPETAEERKLVQELVTIRRLKRLRALEAVIKCETPKKDEDGRKVIRQRQSRGAGKVDFIPGWWFVDQMNALFGHCWDQDVREYKVDWEKKMVYSLVRVEVVRPGFTEIVTEPDGTRIERRYDEVRIGKTQFGSSDIKVYATDAPITKKGTGEILGYSHRKGDVIDIADDLKSATTDGMKKASSWFGLGADVYGRREDSEQSEEDKETSQYNALYKAGQAKGWDKQKVEDWVVEVTKQPLNNLPQHKVLGLIEKLRTSP